MHPCIGIDELFLNSRPLTSTTSLLGFGSVNASKDSMRDAEISITNEFSSNSTLKELLPSLFEILFSASADDSQTAKIADRENIRLTTLINTMRDYCSLSRAAIMQLSKSFLERRSRHPHPPWEVEASHRQGSQLQGTSSEALFAVQELSFRIQREPLEIYS